MTLLSAVQDALYELGGVDVPDDIVNSTNETARRMLRLAKREGEVLSRAHNWTRLQTEYTFQTSAATANYALPAAFGRYLNGTWWDATNSWRLIGPVTPDEWQSLQNNLVTVGLDRYWRQKGGEMYLFPTPTATGDDITYEYQSKYWCESSGGAAQATWAADTDVFRLDERLLIMGLKWRWQAVNGLDYSEEYNEYKAELDQAIARDGGGRDLNMGSGGGGADWPSNLPETGFGV